jgi:Xaa-Pro aminopeptidase
MKLQNYLKKMNIDGLLITDEYSLKYFTGFTGTTGIALVLGERKFFFTDFRYVEQANKQVKPNGFEVVKIEREAVDLIAEYIKNSEIKTLGIEDKSLTLFDYNVYKEKFGEVEFANLNDTLIKERMIKTEEEIKIIRKAVEITDKVFDYALDTIKEGMPEKELAAAMEWFMKKEGGDGPSFETILASNERSAMPHGVASDKTIQKEGFVKFDFGVYYKGYVSDMTRTIYFGENPSDKHKEVYSVVLEAQKKACEAVKAGITCKDLDKIARDYITEKGYGEYFGHGLGHGIGMYIHEHPFVNTKNDMVLEEGMIITIEPGIYLEGFGGVRIEDDVVVRKDYGEILNKSDKNFKIIYRK